MIVGAVIGLLVSILSFTTVLPLAWMGTFTVPAYIISMLLVCFKFYLTGGLVNFMFQGSTTNNNNIFVNFNNISLSTQPVLIFFLIAFGVGLIYLFFQVGIHFVKKLGDRYGDDKNYGFANWKYLIYFFIAIVLIPSIFLVLNIILGSVFVIFERITTTSNTPIVDVPKLLTFLRQKQDTAPNFEETLNKLIEWRDTYTDENAKILANQIINLVSNSYGYLIQNNCENLTKIINQLEANPQAISELIKANSWYSNNFASAYSQVSMYFTQLELAYGKTDALVNAETTLINIANFNADVCNNADNSINTNNLIARYDIFSNPLVINLYQVFTGKSDTFWRGYFWNGSINIDTFDATNWVQVTLAGFVLYSILSILIQFTVISAMLVFQIIYQLLVAPFALARGIDDNGFVWNNWLRNTLQIFVVVFSVAFAIQIVQFLDPIFVKAMSGGLDRWIKDQNSGGITNTDQRLLKSVIVGFFVVSSFTASNLFVNYIRNRFEDKSQLRTNNISSNNASHSNTIGQTSSIADSGGRAFSSYNKIDSKTANPRLPWNKKSANSKSGKK